MSGDGTATYRHSPRSLEFHAKLKGTLAVPKWLTGTSSAYSPHSILWPMLDLSWPPSVPKPKSPQ